MKRNQEIVVSNKLIKNLKEKGFQIQKYYARTTRSIYLKLDYGVCCGIRISDHNGNHLTFASLKKFDIPYLCNIHLLQGYCMYKAYYLILEFLLRVF